MKGGNKDALLSVRDRHTAKNYITKWIFIWLPFLFSAINILFKNMYNYHFIINEVRPE